MRARTIVLLLITACVAAGCASTGSTTARVLPEGTAQAGAGIDLVVAAPQLNEAQRARIPWLQLTGAYRRGLGEGVAGKPMEAGGRVWGMAIPGFATFGAGAGAKLGLRPLAPDERGWEVAAAADVGYHQINLGGAATHSALATLSMPLGYNLAVGQGDQIVITPRLDYQSARSATQTTLRFVFGGVSLGYAWHPFSNFSLLPQVVLLYAPIDFNGTLDDPSRRGYVFSQWGIGAFLTF